MGMICVHSHVLSSNSFDLSICGLFHSCVRLLVDFYSLFLHEWFGVTPSLRVGGDVGGSIALFDVLFFCWIHAPPAMQTLLMSVYAGVRLQVCCCASVMYV